MSTFQKFNNIFGWLSFFIAVTVYYLTLEPTASFWDCGEFIAASYKLQVGHPPGAPLFLLMGKVVSLFAGSDVTKVSVMINFLSALVTAFAVLFLFWTITHLARKVIAGSNPVANDQIATIIGSGFIGAMVITFSDSIWFSAVEGEVYAMSLFFTAITFWAILKWEEVANEKHADRWLVLIAYLIGLSIGVHLLSLLAIPAIGMIYYYKRYPVTTWGTIKAFLISNAVLGVIVALLIPGLFSMAVKFDLLFVNSFGFPFWSGAITYFVLLTALIAFGLYYTTKKNLPTWNMSIMSVAFIIIGYASFAQILVRSAANPPMDENNPENPITLLSYINREQYGDRPLFFGQFYTAKVIDQKEGEMTYYKGADRYMEAGRKVIPEYDPKESTIFPRMYSSQANHVTKYKEWVNIKGDQKPTFGDNLKFFFTYQIGHMYLRYFMWNFSGRQNDIQGLGGITEGNWISGIPFIDSIFLGPQDKIPESMKNNKGRNAFYMLPFILGIIGFLYHYKRNRRDAFVVFLFFMYTGIMNIIYLNQPPVEPRERDYSMVGSFYAYAIWIGLGVTAIAHWLNEKLKGKMAGVIATALCLVVPYVMAKDGWDDHDRSHRKTSRDFAYNYLNSCAPNAILFTNGDNDTFPLWYIQDVEGVRTDVRVINLSLLNTDWYIDQMKQKAYDSDPVPISMRHDNYVQGTRDYVPFYENKKVRDANLRDLIDFISSDDPQAKVRTQGGTTLNYYPTKKFRLPVDIEKVKANGTVPAHLQNNIVPEMEWEISKNYLLKNDLIILDILATNNWERPVYFAITVGSENFLNLEPYFQLEGLAYRIVPVKLARSEGYVGRLESDLMYENVVNRFMWGNMDKYNLYLDENNLRMMMNMRNNFARLSGKLLEEGKLDKAIKTLDRCVEVMPDHNVPYNVFMIRIGEMYYRAASLKMADTLAGNADNAVADQCISKANTIISRLADIYENDLEYYLSLKGPHARMMERDTQQGMAVMQELKRLAREARQEELAKNLEDRFNKLQDSFMKTAGAF